MMRLIYFFEFIVIYMRELTKSNIQVAIEALKFKPNISPGFVKIPLKTKSDDQMLLLANLVTMTPGTVTLDISDDKKSLYAHVLFVKSADETRAEIHTVLEKRILRTFS